jgi:hypothetical protein
LKFKTAIGHAHTSKQNCPKIHGKLTLPITHTKPKCHTHKIYRWNTEEEEKTPAAVNKYDKQKNSETHHLISKIRIKRHGILLKPKRTSAKVRKTSVRRTEEK